MNNYNKSQVKFAITALFPIVLLFAVLRWWPILQSFYLSFTDYSLIKRGSTFIGLKHFIDLLTKDMDFRISLSNTIIFASVTTAVTLLIAIFITVIMDRKSIKGLGFLQSLIFLPVVVSVVPSAMIWKWMYDPQFGIFNYVLSWFGVSSIGWLVDKRYSMFAIVFFVIWKWLGYYMVIFWVGLKGIPELYIEAAKVDGASEWRIVRSVLFPLLKPIFLFALVFATINGFTIYSEIYVMTVGSQGAPGNIVKVLTYDIYERAFLYFKAGQASAEAILLFILVLGLTIIQGKLVRKGELY